MKHFLLTIIAVVVLVGAHGPSVDIHEAVKQHIEAGTDVNSALRGVAKYGQKEIAELLIANGANVNTKDSSGRTL